MLPDGSFRVPPAAPRVPLAVKVMLGAGAVAVVGIFLLIVTLAVSILSAILPVVIIAGGVAWAAMRWQRRQLLRGHRDLRPR